MMPRTVVVLALVGLGLSGCASLQGGKPSSDMPPIDSVRAGLKAGDGDAGYARMIRDVASALQVMHEDLEATKTRIDALEGELAALEPPEYVDVVATAVKQRGLPSKDSADVEALADPEAEDARIAYIASEELKEIRLNSNAFLPLPLPETPEGDAEEAADTAESLAALRRRAEAAEEEVSRLMAVMREEAQLAVAEAPDAAPDTSDEVASNKDKPFNVVLSVGDRDAAQRLDRFLAAQGVEDRFIGQSGRMIFLGAFGSEQEAEARRKEIESRVGLSAQIARN